MAFCERLGGGAGVFRFDLRRTMAQALASPSRAGYGIDGVNRPL